MPLFLSWANKKSEKKKTGGGQDINDMLGQSKDQMTSQHAVMLEKVDKVVCNIFRHGFAFGQYLENVHFQAMTEYLKQFLYCFQCLESQ